MRHGWSRRRVIAASLLALILLLLLLAWTQRKPIAGNFIDRELARRGVQATYDVKGIGFRTQRLENLVIGDPRRPDLTAKWVELDLSLGLRAPKVTLITARGVRLYGRIIDGRLRLGDVDKLLPPPTGAPFSLPDQNIDVADAAMTLDTPAGRLAFAINGRGNLSNSFRGQVAGVSNSLLFGDCATSSLGGNVGVSIRNYRPTITGPIRAARVVCGNSLEIERALAVVDATLSRTIDSWLGRANLQVASIESGAAALGGLSGTASFNGSARLTRGALDLRAPAFRAAAFRGSAARFDGRYAYSASSNRLSLAGDSAAQSVVAGDAALRPIVSALSAANGSPIDPLGDALAAAVARAGQSFDARASLTLVNGQGSGAVRIERLNLDTRSGARLALDGGQGVTYYWPRGLARADGEFALSGGGFPTARLSLNQPRGGGPIRGVARIAPFTAGAARLQLGEVRFTAAPNGATRIDTVAMIDGPFKDGRVVGLLLPISGRLGGTGGFAFGERCIPVSFRALEAGGLRLGPTRVPLCPTGPALIWKTAGGSIRGGAEIKAPRLAGRLGQSPISFVSDRVRFSLADPGFTSVNTEVRLGRPDSVSRFNATTLAGRFDSNGVVGTFAGGSGQIGNVPLLLSDARGTWRVQRGDVLLNGGLTVSDADEEPRFYPLVSNDFRLTMIDNRIDATGWLLDPETGARVAQVAIDHAFASDSGKAVLDVPGIAFNPEFQPEELTRLTTGVVALVDGVLKGRGEIRWTPQGSTSDGVFSTDKMNLAAAFGPVTGLSTTIHFSDLLGLETLSGQIATVDQIQAGIDVFDGRIRYQLLPDLRVRVEAGIWPLAGGTLTLEETILDFSQPSTKRLTFRVVGLDAAAFIQQMEFTSISATGTFDGVLPMEFDQSGGRIVGGRLVARPEGGTLSYVGELSDKALGTYGKLAFDALKSLRYDKFAINLNGSLQGEFLANIELDGLARNTGNPGGIVGRVLSQLAKIPFEFNIAIRGPFRSLIGTARSLEDPGLLIQPVLPEELQGLPIETVTERKEEDKTVTEGETPIVQNQESENMR